MEDLTTNFDTARRFLTVSATVYGSEGEVVEVTTGLSLLRGAS